MEKPWQLRWLDKVARLGGASLHDHRGVYLGGIARKEHGELIVKNGLAS